MCPILDVNLDEFIHPKDSNNCVIRSQEGGNSSQISFLVRKTSMILCVEMVAKQQLALPKSRKYQLSRSWKQESIPKRHRHLSGDKNLWKTDLYSSLKCNLEKKLGCRDHLLWKWWKEEKRKIRGWKFPIYQTQIQCVIPPLLLLIPTMRIEAPERNLL